MTNLTLDQAKLALQNLIDNPPAEGLTLDYLRDLARNVSVDQISPRAPNSITILYSGPLVKNFSGPGEDLRTNAVAVELAQSSANINIIGPPRKIASFQRGQIPIQGF